MCVLQVSGSVVSAVKDHRLAADHTRTAISRSRNLSLTLDLSPALAVEVEGVEVALVTAVVSSEDEQIVLEHHR